MKFVENKINNSVEQGSGNIDFKEFWENVFEAKSPNEVSWTQEYPITPLHLIEEAAPSKEAKIIDIGGGDSHIPDFLLKEGYQNISVLDISSVALKKSQKRLGSNADKIQWIEANILDFTPNTTYDVWYDRAVFHFLTSEEDIQKYVQLVSQVAETIIIATFSTSGPTKCSGLPISQYNEETLQKVFAENYIMVKSFTENHITPFNTEQNFIFCQFQKK